MVKVYSRKDPETLLATLQEINSCRLVEELNGRYELSLTYPLFGNEEVQHLAMFNLLEADGQLFRIFHVSKDSKSHLIRILARHIFYDLAGFVLDELTIENKTSHEALQLVLAEAGVGAHFSAIGTTSPKRDLHLKQVNASEAILRIANEWGGILLRDNFNLRVADPEAQENAATIQYGENLVGVSEESQGDEVVTRIYPIGANDLRLPEGFLDRADAEEAPYPSFPLSRFVAFDEAETVEELRSLAEKYLLKHGKLEPNLAIDCALFKENGELLQVRIGDLVTVKHQALEMDWTKQVVVVDRNLLLPIGSKIELGKPLQALDDYLTRLQKTITTTVSKEDAAVKVEAWAAKVMEHVESVLGGSVRNVNPRLLLYTSGSHQGKRRKFLSDVADVLIRIKPNWKGSEDTAQFYVDGPLNLIRQRKNLTLQRAYFIIDDYIRATVGQVGSGNLVSLVNGAYHASYGQGQTAARAGDTMETVFGDEWPSSSMEYYYANRILGTLASYVGNISNLYLEIGGGSGGVIGAMNDLYRKLSETDNTVSVEKPNSELGKEGDLWLRFEEELSAGESGTVEMYRKQGDEYVPYRPETDIRLSIEEPDGEIGCEGDSWLRFVDSGKYDEPGTVEIFRKQDDEYVPYRPETDIKVSSDPPSSSVGYEGDSWLRFAESENCGETGTVEFYRKQTDEYVSYAPRIKPGITVSDLEPDDGVGEDGDLWFRFE